MCLCSIVLEGEAVLCPVAEEAWEKLWPVLENTCLSSRDISKLGVCWALTLASMPDTTMQGPERVALRAMDRRESTQSEASEAEAIPGHWSLNLGV